MRVMAILLVVAAQAAGAQEGADTTAASPGPEAAGKNRPNAPAEILKGRLPKAAAKNERPATPRPKTRITLDHAVDFPRDI